MKLSENFSINEFLKTNRNFVFRVTDEEIENLKSLCQNLLQPIRDYIGNPIRITINGGLRPEPLNSMVGGAKTSDHISGKASDIDVKDISQPELFRNCCLAIRNLKLEFKQIILELDSNCVHISYDKSNNRKQVLVRFKTKSGKQKYVPIDLDFACATTNYSKFVA